MICGAFFVIGNPAKVYVRCELPPEHEGETHEGSVQGFVDGERREASVVWRA